MTKMTDTAAAIGAATRELRLPVVPTDAAHLAEIAQRSQQGYLAFLAEVLSAEVDERIERRRQRRVHEARFPRPKRLADFDLDAAPTINPATIATLASCAYLDAGEPIVLLGDSGTGKSHLLIGLAMAACEHGRRVRYATAAQLVNELAEAADERRLSRIVARYGRLDLLCLDELGYVQLDARGSDLLFQILTEREGKATEQPARVWISPAAATRLAAALDGGAYEIALRLSDPDQAESFAAAHPEVSDTWQEQKGDAATDLQELAASLAALAAFVVGLTIATAAILVAGRMAAQIRQVGTLKAVGVTPGQVTCVLLVEYLTVAFLATAVGLAAGTLLAPPLARLTRVLSVYGAQTAPITLSRAAIVVAVATSVVLLATVRPALRGVRRSTLHSLSSNTRQPHRAGRLNRALARLPLPCRSD